jgi:PAS domain S-box-containing protein
MHAAPTTSRPTPSVSGAAMRPELPENANDTATVVDAIRMAARGLDVGEAAVIATDTNGTILYWNEAATVLYGWRSAEVQGRNVLDVTPVLQNVAEATAIMGTVLSGVAWSGRFDVRDKDGRQMQVHVTDLPVLHHGRVVGIVGLSSPIAES